MAAFVSSPIQCLISFAFRVVYGWICLADWKLINWVNWSVRFYGMLLLTACDSGKKCWTYWQMHWTIIILNIVCCIRQENLRLLILFSACSWNDTPAGSMNCLCPKQPSWLYLVFRLALCNYNTCKTCSLCLVQTACSWLKIVLFYL